MKLRSLAVLYWLNENPDVRDAQVPEEVCPKKYVPGVYEELKENHLIVDERSVGGHTFAVLPRAVERVEELAGLFRPEAIRRAVLEEIRRNPDQGSTEDYLVKIDVLGGDVTAPELLSAVKALSEAGHIKGIRSLQTGSHLIRPELTTSGEAALRSTEVAIGDGASTGRAHGNTTHNSVNVYDSTVGAVSAGDQNTLTVYQQNVPGSVLPELFSELKSAFQELELHDADRNRYVGQIEMIEDEFEDEKDEERANKSLKRFLQKTFPQALMQNLGQLVPSIATILGGTLGG